MGFRGRLKRAKDESRSIEERVQALCDALTYSHLGGYHATWRLLEQRFGIVLGKPASPEVISAAVEFLEVEREAWLAWNATNVCMHRRMKRLGLPPLTAR